MSDGLVRAPVHVIEVRELVLSRDSLFSIEKTFEAVKPVCLRQHNNYSILGITAPILDRL